MVNIYIFSGCRRSTAAVFDSVVAFSSFLVRFFEIVSNAGKGSRLCQSVLYYFLSLTTG